MKSISTIIASILMLLIVLTLAGTAYLYISGTLTGKTSTAFEIMDSYQDTITIRNSGTGPITSFRSVKIDNNDAVYLVTKPDSSLVGYWKFDELNQTGALDSSGKGNQGTFTGEIFNDGTIIGATFTSGQYGSALSFDGVDDYVSGSISPQADFSKGFTISVWAYYNAITNGCPLFFGFIGVNRFGLDAGCNSNNPYVFFRVDPNEWSVGTSISLNQWTYLTAVWNPSLPTNNLILYRNGVQVGITTAPTSISLTNQNLGIGGPFGYFNGIIDEVRIYNRALTLQEIQEDMNSTYPINRTVAWYNFENDAKDKHNIVKGKYGSAFSFDGANDYADVTDSASLNPSNTITLEAWIKRKTMSSPGSMPIINKDGFSPNRDYGMWLNSGDGQNLFLEIMNGIDGVCSIQGTTVLSTDTWYHVAATHDGSNIRLFINGNQEASASCTQAIGNTGTPLRIGCRGGCGALNSFNGTIDEVKIYNRALSSQEVKGSYNIGSQINAGEAATIKIYNQLSKGTHTVRMCTSSMCNVGYLTIT